VCVRLVGGGMGVRADTRARAFEHATALRTSVSGCVSSGCVNVCMGSQYLSVTHIYTDTQSHKCDGGV